MYSNCCCRYLFENEIIKIGLSSHKIYNNDIVNFQESTIILNACTKKSGNLLIAPRICIYAYICIYMCVCVKYACMYIYMCIYAYMYVYLCKCVCIYIHACVCVSYQNVKKILYISKQAVMMAYERSESARDNFGKFMHQYQPEIQTLIRKLERILIKLCRQNVSLLFNQTCLNESPITTTHTHMHTHTNIYICRCIYIYIHIYI